MVISGQNETLKIGFFFKKCSKWPFLAVFLGQKCKKTTKNGLFWTFSTKNGQI